MKLPKLSKLAKIAQRTVGQYSPQILTGVGIAGMVTTVVLAVKATPKALTLIENKKDELKADELTVVDTVKVAWKPYIPAVITGVAATTCLIGGTAIGLRRTAALAAAYKISETALLEYKDKVIETIGEDQEKVIREKVAQEKIDKDPVTTNHVYMTANNDILCYDPLSGRYFKSTIEDIKAAQNAINELLINEMYASLNDFYDSIGLGRTKLGKELGWNIDSGTLQIDFDSALSNEESEQQGIHKDTPCLVLDYNLGPKYNFDKMCY